MSAAITPTGTGLMAGGASAARSVSPCPTDLDVKVCSTCQGSGIEMEEYEFRRLEVRLTGSLQWQCGVQGCIPI